MAEVNTNRAQEAIAFDQSKTGVKGLIDAGVAKLPSIFVQPPESRPDPSEISTEQLQVPVISLDGVESGKRRAEIMGEIREASETWGFFQVVNHGVPLSVMSGLLESIKRFHEQPSEMKKEFYSRDNKVKYYSTSALHVNQTAHWRDTLAIDFDKTISDPQSLPLACREAFVEYLSYMSKLRYALSELLSEALGLQSDYLEDIQCMERHRFVCHYYPPCPQPDLALGLTRHSDPSFLTILLQDNIGGLQVLHKDKWVNVTPMEGAFVINIGDFLQLVTNDKFKSVEHRVLAGTVGPRISCSCLLFPSEKNHYKVYGPINELLADGTPPRYRAISPSEYDDKYLARGLDGSQVLDWFRL
ncbi:hypothetical protein Vadar_010573 [Vaccinium darrowii]|uniref:Uncharacterized protein n=1 Tax=Vaccinium darrowii TaxID=229202 RepID=A0ACB7X992_9ERIC|nr:hypothetical protein Vadar_010573 [Vaccinium darrowii]